MHRPEVNRSKWRAACVVALAVADTAACGGSDDGNDTSGGKVTDGSTGPAEVTVETFKFMPSEVTAKAGQVLTFTNKDGQAHTATADTGEPFDTGSIAAGAKAEVTAPKAGSYPYHCSLHPFMTGTMTVT